MRKNEIFGLLVLCLCVFAALILKHEKHLKHSQSIFVRLTPVDPRSLLQGDYMDLRYDWHWSEQLKVKDKIAQRHKILVYVKLDAQQRVISTQFNPASDLQALWVKNPSNHSSDVYAAANSFFFAEGLANCYQQAQYAELKVTANGAVLLVDLRGEQLKKLNCAQQKNWWS